MTEMKKSFEKHWKDIQADNPKKYDERFYRTWRYYLLSTAPGFLASKALLWHFVFSRKGVEGGYVFPPVDESKLAHKQ